MPARIPVVAEWTSSNPEVAWVSNYYKQIPCVSSVPSTNAGCYDLTIAGVSGISNGVADIKAAYKPSYGDGREIMMAAITATARVTVGSVPSVPSITVISPNGGEQWQIGGTYTIKYSVKNTDVGPDNPIYIYLEKGYDAPTTKSGVNSSMLIATTKDTESYTYTVPTGIQSWPGIGNNYTIKVCARFCSISDSSDSYFSITSASYPSITVLSPNGGETWIKGLTQTIKWRDNTPIPSCPVGAQCAPPPQKPYDIKLVPYYPPQPPCTVNPCPTYAVRVPYTIASSVFASWYSWSVGKIMNTYGAGDTAPDGSYTVQVCQTGTDICDSSDSYFKIVNGGTTTNSSPVINMFPAIPSVINVGQFVSFSWGAIDADGDNLSWGVSWGEGTGAAGACQSPNPQNKQGWTFNTSHAWANPGTYTVKATVNDCRGGSNEHMFNVTVGSIVMPSITILSPNGGEVWQRGQNVVIKWNSTNAPTVMVDLVRPGYEYHLTGPTGDIANTGSLQYMVPADMQVASDYRIRVMHRVNAVPVAEDFSNAPFSIAAATTQSPITVLSPNGGEVLQKGTPMTIKWNYDGNYGERSVRIDLVDANPSYGGAPNPVLLIANYIPINSNNYGPTNSGSYTWTIPTTVPAGTYYKIRLMVSGTEGYIDESDVPFAISGILGL